MLTSNLNDHAAMFKKPTEILCLMFLVALMVVNLLISDHVQYTIGH